MDKTKNKKIKIYPMQIVLFIMVLLMIVIPFRHVGYLSKLKYASFNNFIAVPIVDKSSITRRDSDLLIDESNYRKRCDILLNYMVRFIYDVYGINLKIPKYSLVMNDDIQTCSFGKNENLTIRISKMKLECEKENYEVVLIHELFHILSCQDGAITRINFKSDAYSILAEGYTDFLTDKFIDYMDWDSYLKLENRSRYYYFRKIVECIFEEEGKEIEFAKYYFLDDFSFNNVFNIRVRIKAWASLVYYPYDNLEMHLRSLFNNDFCTEIDFFISYELIAYYCSWMNDISKEKVEKKFYDIEAWAKQKIFKGKNIDFSYFHNLFYS